MPERIEVHAVTLGRTAGDSAKDAAKNRDEVALELMKFIAVTTGYGKGSATAAASRASRPKRPRSTPTR